MTLPSIIHAPVLTRHGWVQRRYSPVASTRGSADNCTAASTHKVWQYGFQAGRTLILDAHICDHDQRAAREDMDAQGVLW